MSLVATSTWTWVGLGTTLGVMITAVVTDVRYARIPNHLTYPAAIIGVLVNYLASGPAGLKASLLGMALGFVILFAGMMFGGIGGGDVKLGAALGALVGVETTFLGLIYMGLLAGAIAVGIMIWKGKLLNSLKRMGRFMFTSLIPTLETEKLEQDNSDAFPLGVAIVGGFLWAMIEKIYGAQALLDLNL